MARSGSKRKSEVRIRTFGIYTKWDSDSKDLPQLAEITTTVRAVVDVEFGFIVNIRGAKNQRVRYCINHPGILDPDGKTRPPFEGFVFVKTNDWDFYLGDTIWEPIADKLGLWKMSVELDGCVVAEKTFDLYNQESL